jgi:hypothetical protein
MMMAAGDNSWLVHQSSPAVLPAETSGASMRNGRRSENSSYKYLKYLKRSLTCLKILRHGTSSLTSHPKEGVQRIFIALKNPSPRPRLYYPLGTTASVPRAYDIFTAYEGMTVGKIRIMKWKIRKNLIQNKIQDLNNTLFFKKTKLIYKPTCEVGSVWEEHISVCV